MKSKTSCFNKTIFKKNITHYWPLWTIYLLYNLLVLPVMSWYSEKYGYHDPAMSKEEAAAMRDLTLANLTEGYMLPLLLFAVSVIAAMAVFSYLYSARSAYNFHAFPVTRKMLFVTNYLSGLCFLLVPQFAGFLFGTLVSAACGYGNLGILLKGWLMAGGMTFFFYSFVVFVGMFTGQLLALPVFAVILNVLVVGVRILGNSFVSNISYGLTESFFAQSRTSRIDVFSPLIYLSNHIGISYDNVNYGVIYNTVFKDFTGGKAVVGYALVAVVFLVLAYVVYSKREIETAGSLISVPWIAPIFRWGVSLCGAGLAAVIIIGAIGRWVPSRAFKATFLSALIFGAIFFFVTQMFLDKGFRVFKKKRICECLILLAVIAAGTAAIEYDVFGIEKRIPNASDVKKAYISYGYPVGGDTEEEIAEVMELHKQIIESKKEFETYLNQTAKNNDGGRTTEYLQVRYFLNNGSIQDRCYLIPADDEMFEDSESVCSKLNKMMATPELYIKSIFGTNYKDMTIGGGSFDLYEGERQLPYVMNKEEAEKVYQAYLKDVEEGNFNEQILTQSRWEESRKIVFRNTIYFDCYYKDGFKKDVDRVFYQNSDEEDYRFERAASIENGVTFNTHCENIINALKEIGAIKDVGDLITHEQSEEIENNFID